jgi:hypothetical protein
MTSTIRNASKNDLLTEDQAIHSWYRFVLSFPPHLVRDYLNRFGIDNNQIILDPFCGTGTTVVECKKLGSSAIGLEASPMAHFASSVKTDWTPDPSGLRELAAEIAQAAQEELAQQGIDDILCFRPLEELPLQSLPAEASELLLAHSIDPLPLHKTLVLLNHLDNHKESPFYNHLRLALARSTVQDVSNVHFGPEVGVRGRKPRAPVIQPWLEVVKQLALDLEQFHNQAAVSTTIHRGDARQIDRVLAAESVAAVITSPPYPNEKDYSRTTRLESVLLGFLNNGEDLRSIKRGLLRSNTRTVYKGDDDEQWIADNREVNQLADRIDAKRLELGKTSGFEKLYGRVTRLYFGGMTRHLAALRSVLQPGAHLAYVLGDQASYFQVMIHTGQIVARIAETLGYRCESIELFRTRQSTATREQLREEVVVLSWPGHR